GDGDLKGFGVCDKDGKWHWATAKITGKLTIELTAPAGVTITRVCYNWGGNPRGNLVDGAGHPAGLFRSELEK
ncbi:MAG: acetyl esterase, partial [Phycisphaerales bacterium]|nr:acetyl esterase [Phycisphaerales bacterium]